MADRRRNEALQSAYNALWLFMVWIRTVLIRTGILRLRIGRLDLNSFLHRLGSRILPSIDRDITVSLTTGQQLTVPAGHAGGRIHVTGTYEQEVTALFMRLLKESMTVIDLGAHLGYYTLLASHRVGPQGAVYAFEPDPNFFPLLVGNVEANACSNVTTIQKAISNKTGEVELWCETNAGGSNLYTPTGSFANSTATVETTTLDEFFGERGWPSVDLVKIDIEGAETAALEGMRALSDRNPDLSLVVEFLPRAISYSSSPEEFLAELNRCGFKRFFVIEDNLRPLLPQDLPWLVRRAEFREVNLLCEKGSVSKER